MRVRIALAHVASAHVAKATARSPVTIVRAPSIIMNLAFFCFLSAACVGTVFSHGLISQSAIYQCDWGDETEPSVGAETCKQKFVVSMALSSGQVCGREFISAPILNRCMCASFI